MMSPAPQEQKSFYYFIFLVFITAFYFSKENTSDMIVGIVTMLWGLLGFYRYLYLNHSEPLTLPKILTLPSRILFGLNQQQDKQIKLTTHRFLKPDILWWLALSFIFILWMLYCSFYPTEISIIQSFLEENKKILATIDKTEFQAYIILQKLSYYFMISLIVFNGMSYSQGSLFSKTLKIIFLPVIVTSGGYIMLFLPTSILTLYADFSHIKGIGWGQFQLFDTLVQDQLQNADSAFLRRYIEGGIIGAYGIYIIFLPALVTLIKQIFVQKQYGGYLFAIAALTLLFLLDILWIPHPFINGLQPLLLAFTAYFWGHSRGASSNP